MVLLYRKKFLKKGTLFGFGTLKYFFWGVPPLLTRQHFSTQRTPHTPTGVIRVDSFPWRTRRRGGREVYLPMSR